jgi:hypothetical protein
MAATKDFFDFVFENKELKTIRAAINDFFHFVFENKELKTFWAAHKGLF